MLSKFYLAAGMFIIFGYGVLMLTGWGLSSSRREQIPPGVRNSPGGYRSFHYPWHSGYRGGK
jgi:hypothetical protein